MKKLTIAFSFLFIINACNLNNALVHTAYDDFRKDSISLYQYSGTAHSLFKNKHNYSVDIDFINNKKKTNSEHKAIIKINLSPDQILKDSVFMKMNNNIYAIKAQNIQIVNLQGVNNQTVTNLKTEAVKQNEKGTDSIIKQELVTRQSSHTYNYNRNKLHIEIPDDLLQNLGDTGELQMRIYIDELPYTVILKKHKLKKIRQVYGLSVM